MVRRVLITGAAGYLGRAVTRHALAQGWSVRALVRSGDAPEGAEIVRGDLASMDVAPLLTGVDAVIHTAAAMTGTDADMARDTVRATERLALAMSRGGTAAHLVLAGSMAVYAAGPENGLIDEASAVEPAPQRRDAYTRAKLAQEFAAAGAGPVWICRIGAVWGPGRTWHGHIGAAAGPVVVRIGKGEIPLCHVDHGAAALVLAAGTKPDGRQILNILDDERPDAARYLAALRQGGWPRTTLPLHWKILDALSGIAPARAPGLLRREVLRARMMPRRYDNARAKTALGWTPHLTFGAAMADALAHRP